MSIANEMLPFLSASDLAAMDVPTNDVVAMIEQLLRASAAAAAWNAPKMVIMPPDGRYMMATLSAADDPPYLAVKSLVMNPANREKNLSEINALVTLLDSATGVPLAVIEGNWVTALRTAGLSAVAAKRLARPESSVMAFIGCGLQAHSHLRAFRDLFPLKSIRAFNRGRENREKLCQAASAMGLATAACASAEEAIDGADLVVTSISWSKQASPFIDAAWMKPGAFASVVDLAVPWIDSSMSAFDTIIIDDLAQESKMEQPLVDLSLVGGDLTGLVTDAVPGRRNADEKTAFVFRGLALGDLALAALAYQGWLRQSRR